MKVSISKVRLFKSCRRAYELKYIEELEPVVSSPALEIGLSYHNKIEELYKNGSFDDSDMTQASAMAKAYEKYVYPHLKMKSVEDWFEYRLCPEHTVIGRVDGVVDSTTLVEHKTTGGNLAEYEYDLDWDEQIPCYMLAYGVNRMVYTIVKKPTIRRRQNETMQEFYDRMVRWYDDDTNQKITFFTVTRSNEELNEFKSELIKMCDEMERAEATGMLYKNPSYCHKWNTLCEYAQVCNHYDPNETYINLERRDYGYKASK